MSVHPSAQASVRHIQLEFESLRARLEEAEQTLEAIRSGEVDALVVYGERGEQVYTLRGAEQPYRIFVEQMLEGAATLDEDGLVLYSNQRLADMVGLPLERLIGSDFAALLWEGDAGALKSLFGQALELAVRGEVQLVGPAGPVPVQLAVTCLPEEHGAHYAVIVTDLTEQKRNEQIMASERLTRSIFDNATEAIVVCDPAGRIIRASAAAKRLAGQDPMFQLLTEALPLSFAPPRSGEATDPIAKALEGEPSRALEASLDGRDLLVSVAPLLGEDGERLGCVVTMTDISERNRAFREVRELNETLERRVQERTEQLVAANKELEGFCYSVSHDLRAPLRSMVAGAMILREDFAEGLPPEAEQEMERMTRAANKMSTLIDDLLRFSRLGRQEMRCQQVDLSLLARSVAHDLKVGDAAHVQFHIQDGLWTDGDESLMRMALENLMGNAVKFTKEKPDAQIWVGAEAQDGHTVYFVRDNGIGFDPQYAEKIFLPFERLNPENRYPGTGIGLANVHRIVARHGGRVWAESEPGAGTTMRFATTMEC